MTRHFDFQPIRAIERPDRGATAESVFSIPDSEINYGDNNCSEEVGGVTLEPEIVPASVSLDAQERLFYAHATRAVTWLALSILTFRLRTTLT